METEIFSSYLKEMPNLAGKREVPGQVIKHFGGNSFLLHIEGDNAAADEATLGYYDLKKAKWWNNNCGMIDGQPKIPYFKDRKQFIVTWRAG